MNKGKKGILSDNDLDFEGIMKDMQEEMMEEKKEKMKQTEEDWKADKNKKAKHKEGKEMEEEAKKSQTDNEAKKSQTEEEGQKSQKEDATQKAEEEAMGVKYLRLMADFQNYKRRVEKEKSDIYAFANEKIVLELLDVIDNFERALSHQGEEGNVISDGMNMIYKQLKAVLEKSGLQEIEALGQEFDPNFHNAVMMEESEEYEPGKVTLVMQKGYILNKKVIRHTMVRVAK